MNITTLQNELADLATNARKQAEKLARDGDENAKVFWANVELAIDDARQQIEKARTEYRAMQAFCQEQSELT